MEKSLRQSVMISVIAVGLVGIFGGANATEASPSSVKWIHGSFVNLRQAPQNNAKVVAQWPTNTQVRLIAEQGKWCEVAGPNEAKGYVACTLLGTAALTLSDAASAKDDDAVRRAFWIAPSWERLAAVGEVLYKTLMSDAQRANEITQQKAARRLVPEFEAMKARLRDGVKLQPAQEIVSAVVPVNATALSGLPANILPKAKISLFKSHTEVVLDATVDQAAALRGSTLALRKVLREPQAQSGRDEDTWMDGTWDIGEAVLGLEPAAISYSISADGVLGSSSLASAQVTVGPPNSACGYVDLQQPRVTFITFGKADGETAADGGTDVQKDLPIVTFFSSHGIKAESVKAKMRELRVASMQPDGTRMINKVAIHEIDFDNDGNADMVVVNGQIPGQIGPFVNRTRIFININGVWSMERDVTEEECT